MKKKYLKPEIMAHTVEVTIMAGSPDITTDSTKSGVVDNGEELGSGRFDFVDEEYYMLGH